MSEENSTPFLSSRCDDDDPKTVLYYRLRSAITDGNEEGVSQILKLRSMTSSIFEKLCPHPLWDKVQFMCDSTEEEVWPRSLRYHANSLWSHILGTDLEDRLEDSLLTLACNLGHESIACMIVDAVKSYALDIPCSRCKIWPSYLLEKEGPNGLCPLQICAKKGLVTVASKLLKSGCDVNRKGLGVYQTALLLAVQKGHVEMALLLLERGANPNTLKYKLKEHGILELNPNDEPSDVVCHGFNNGYPTAFQEAVTLGHDRVVEAMLLSGRCNVNRFYPEGGQDLRPVGSALRQIRQDSSENRIRVLKLLLQHGAVIESFDDLKVALKASTVEVLKELFKFGADPNVRHEIKKTLFFDLCSETISDRIAKIEAFIEAKVDPNLKDDSGDVALHYACGGYMPEVIRRLARIPGIDVNAVNDEGISPLMLLLCSKSLPSDTQEIVSLLEAVPFDYSLKDRHGRNMFCYAAMSQALDLLNFLVRKGVNPQAADAQGNSPFVYALCSGHLKVAAGLVCLTKNLPTDWRMSHPSLDIFRLHQDFRGTSLYGHMERAYASGAGEPLLQLGLVHGLMSLQNPFYRARIASRLPDVGTIKGYNVSLFLKALLSKNYDVNIRDSRGETALCLLLKHGHWHAHIKISVVVLLLLEHGADPDIPSLQPSSVHQEQRSPDASGSREARTPLDHAMEAKNVHVATYLYLAGARLDRSRQRPFLRDMERRHVQLLDQARFQEDNARNGGNLNAPPPLPPNDALILQPPPLPPNHPPPDQIIDIPLLGPVGVVAGAAPADLGYPNIAAVIDANADVDAEAENRVPPAHRRRRRSSENGSERHQCVYFTPPHRCIVCLTQFDAPSLAILARRAARYALRGKLQHFQEAAQLGIPNQLFDYFKMIDFE